MTPAPRGLSTEEAARRLAHQGPNEIGEPDHHGFAQTLKGVLSEPMFLLLIAGAALYLLVGDLAEGLLLGAFALATVGLVVVQQRRGERALDALRELAAPQVRVWRDGRPQRIAARELVVGDWILLAEGERVGADASIREASALALDESLLTGESAAVHKQATTDAGEHAAADANAGADSSGWVYAGTLVVAGHGLAEVEVTGRGTQVGRIGASLNRIELAPTPLQRQLRRVVRLFSLAALAACAALAVWYGLQRHDWLQGALAAIALAMAMLPEEFPMVFSVFIALGAWRLTRQQVLARRPATVEALGAASVLCVDKTGTLTENRMRLTRLVTDWDDVEDDGRRELPEAVRRLLEHALLASRRDGFDAMDRALFERGEAALAGSGLLHPDWRLLRSQAPTPGLMAVTQTWADDAGGVRVASKGAPEAIFERCHLDAPTLDRQRERVRQLASQGLRVLAVARGSCAGPDPAEQGHDVDFKLLGLLAFEDPLRPSAAAAVHEARQAGIAVIMITGDHALTAQAIATQAGLDTRAGVLDGPTLDALDDERLAEALRTVRVFARIRPEQKLRLVEALRRQGAVVAMTGDGVNDAPALKAAHIGIAMGRRGTDVAREAASLVLMDEDLGRLVDAIRLGRRMADNLRRVSAYIAAIHVPIAGLALLPLAIGLPPLLLPVHVVLIEMIIDPMCSLAFENLPDDPQVMRRPPRPANEALIGWPSLWRGLQQGLVLLVAVLAIYGLALQAGRSIDTARTLAVLSLTAGNLALAALNAGALRLRHRGLRPFWWVAAATSALLALALAWPAARALLRWELPAGWDLALALAGTALAIGLAALRTGRQGRGLPR